MKKTLLVTIWIFGLVPFALSQPAGPEVKTGDLNGAAYKIFIPENWNKNLVLYAHGYEFMNTPGFLDNPMLVEMLQPFLQRGFAVAASAYRGQGYVLPEGIEDTEALRAHFAEVYEAPDSTFIVGISMGGGVAIGAIERFAGSYHGALALCPLSSQPYLQTRKEFDLITVFNAMFPGAVPAISSIMDTTFDLPNFSFMEAPQKAAAIREQFMQDSLKAVQLAQRFDLKLKDLPFTVFFGQGVLRDIARKAGGNPYDNTNTLYSGFPDDWLINQKVERLSADPVAAKFMNTYSPTGELTRPVVLLHTIYDQLIPPQLAVVNYDNMVHRQGSEKFLVVKYTNGQGHCQFSPVQIGAAFDLLRKWTAKGERPKPGSID